MSELWVRVRPLLLTARALVRAAVLSVVRHWVFAIFSLLAAFAIWFLVEDVENPRIEITVPVEGQPPVPVEVVNVPNGLIVGDVSPVRVFVEAREEEADDLRAGDFSAIVDASDVRAGDVRSLPVVVTTARGDVRVVRSEPRTVEVSVAATVSRELPVTVVLTGELPSGFRQGLPEVDPPFVTITGRAELVESVNEVQATVSILGLQNTQTFNVELTSRTGDGARVTVTLSRNRARVTIPVEEALLTRQIAVLGGVRGRPAQGYTVTDVTVSPSPIEVTGPREIVERLTTFVVEDADVSGAIAQVIESRPLTLPDEVTATVDTVFISVSISPQAGWRTLLVAPTFVDVPEGFEVAPGVYAVRVRVAGDEPALARLGIDDVGASISFEGAPPPPGPYEADVSVPEGIEIVAVEPIAVELVEVGEPAPEEESVQSDETAGSEQ